MAEIKRVTLHPLKKDGTIDTDINLYPKTLSDGIVDRNGNEFPIQEQLVSGENIKTINGEPILGEGNIQVATEGVDLTSDQTVEGDKTWQNIATFNDTAIFNSDVFVRGNLKDQEDNSVAIKDISKATNLENGTGNGSLIQTNVTLNEINTWTSSDSEVATVNEHGLVTAVAPGEATITCMREGAEAECLVTVTPRLFMMMSAASIGLEGYEIIESLDDISDEDEIYLISKDGSKQFNGQIEGSNTKYGGTADIVEGEDLLIPLTFTNISDNEYTITYNDNGNTKYLYWNSGNSLNAGSDRDPTSRWLISFDNNQVVIANKSDSNRKIYYNSGSPRFACYSNAQALITLVKKPSGPVISVESVELDEHELELDSGEEFTLTATVLPEDATNKHVTWESSDTDVVAVDNQGNLTAGLLNVTSTATITVTTVDGEFTDTCEVTVKKMNGPAIRLSSGHLKLRTGDTAQLTVKYVETNIASGDLSIALGHSNTVTGNNSVAIGSELTASHDNQVVIGKYNYNKNNTLFEVGNGTVDSASNALEVHNDGSVRVYKAPSNNNDVTNKKYVDDGLANKANKSEIPVIEAGVEGIPNTSEILSSVKIDDISYNLQPLRLSFEYSHQESGEYIDHQFHFIVTPTFVHVLISDLNDTLTQLELSTISSPTQIPSAIKSIAHSDAWSVIGQSVTSALFLSLCRGAILANYYEEVDGLTAPLCCAALTGLGYCVPSFADGFIQARFDWQTIISWIPDDEFAIQIQVA